MGISGLLPLLKKASTNCHVRRFSGCTVAVDAYGWLHKGAFGCAAELGKGEQTTKYITYCVKYINVLLAHNIKPVMVLDGRNLPSKSQTEKKRREKREDNRRKAREYLRKGMKKEAWECFTRCVDITPAMAREFIKVLREMNVDYVVAPYEADAQLAYMAVNNLVDIVITEDSDLILFGCPKIFFKFSMSGDGVLFDQSKIAKSLSMKKKDNFSFKRFRWMCIMSGCDYLASLPGVGLGRARKVIEGCWSEEIDQVLKYIPKIVDVEVTEEYIQGFIQAEQTFLYQLVFDTKQRQLVPLNPYEEGIVAEELHFAGSYVEDKIALGLALGNIDLHTLKRVDAFEPSSATGYGQNSIWSSSYTLEPQTNAKEKTTNTSIVGGMEIHRTTVTKKKIKRHGKETTTDMEVDDDFLALYSNSENKSIEETLSDDGELLYESGAKRKRELSPKKRVNPFLKKSPVCLIERNKIYGGDDNEDENIIVKSQYFRRDFIAVEETYKKDDAADTKSDCDEDGDDVKMMEDEENEIVDADEDPDYLSSSASPRPPSDKSDSQQSSQVTIYSIESSEEEEESDIIVLRKSPRKAVKKSPVMLAKCKTPGLSRTAIMNSKSKAPKTRGQMTLASFGFQPKPKL